VAYELRTTLHPALLSDDDLRAMATDLHARGIRQWVLQIFRPTGCSDAALLAATAPATLDALLPELRQLVPDIVVR
jgi:hypothetical protein